MDANQWFRAGELIAERYELIAPIGRGAMGSVYSARDRELDVVVALKVLHAYSAVESAESVVRFKQEVKLARRVTHSNVARTYDIGEHRGTRFLTMELVEGESLASTLAASGAMPLDRALHIARQMCAGMAAAHDAGVIHRDLKPENVCIARDGRVVLMDFGIARAPLGDAASLTGPGMLGTPAYMAPEQVTGTSDVDPRADLYAFGTVLFEMVTGRSAWMGASAYTVAMARLTTPPPDPRNVKPELPATLAELIMRCMATEPSDRYRDAHALLAALDAVAPPSPASTRFEAPAAELDAPRSLGVSTRESAAPPPPAIKTTGSFPRTTGVEGFREDLAQQRVLMGERAPVYARVLEVLDRLLAHSARATLEESLARSWQKRIFEGPYERPLLMLAALRFDALVEGPTHPLFEAIASPSPRLDAVTSEALTESLAPHRLGFWITLRSRRVQTNEVSRSITWIWPAMLAGCGERRRPLALVDVGASAGLNLAADSLSLAWRRRGGGVITMPSHLLVRARVGFDPRPLDVKRKEDRLWLQACIWPGENDRITRLEAAIRAYRSATPSPELQLLRASSVPAQLEPFSKLVGPGGLVLVYHTLVRGYIPRDEREVYESEMHNWLRAGRKGERAWASLELYNMSDPSYGCAIEVQVATGGDFATVRLGATSYHPSVVDANAAAERELSALFA